MEFIKIFAENLNYGFSDSKRFCFVSTYLKKISFTFAKKICKNFKIY